MSNPLSITVAVCFVAGMVGAQHFTRLPPAWSLIALALAGIALSWRNRLRFAGVALLGAAWALSYGAWRLADILPKALEKQDLVIEGAVDSIPGAQEEGIRFDFSVAPAQGVQGIPRRLRLNWYRAPFTLRAAERWRLCVRLHRPHGFFNPGGLDYEQWLFAAGVGATGYVRDCPQNARLAETGNFWSPGVWRQALYDRLHAALAGREFSGIIQALVMGADDDISPEQWEVFRRTGTTHLVAISGSHISLIAGIAFLLARKSCALLGLLRCSPQRLAAVFALLAALAYGALADFAIPTQRALIMIAVLMGGVFYQRRLRAWHTLGLALLAVTALDPLAVLAPGFWLSFAAVALILLAVTGRLGPSSWLGGLWEINWATSLGLAPLLILFFQQVSLISPLANLLAVPALGVLAIPLCLMGCLILLVDAHWGGRFLGLVESYMELVWQALKALSSLPLAQWHHPPLSSWALSTAAAGAVLLLMPRGVPGRWLGLVLLIPALSERPNRPEAGEFRLTLLDVGQALSAVIQTHDQFLVFDTGARLSPSFDTGSAVVEPFLRHQGAERIEVLVLSHGDNDHIGGTDSLLKAFPVERLYTSVPEQLRAANPLPCQAGQHWEADGIHFEMLSPMGKTGNDNNLSCVLKVSNGDGCVLLTGDIERPAEEYLVLRYGSRLRCQALIAPHHGSKSSSSELFLEAVRPRYVLIPAGYLNRYGFPHPDVLRRYRAVGAQSLDTAEEGAISVEFRSRDGVEEPLSWREQAGRYWNAMPERRGSAK